jgi:hypothetical protein
MRACRGVSLHKAGYERPASAPRSTLRASWLVLLVVGCGPVNRGRAESPRPKTVPAAVDITVVAPTDWQPVAWGEWRCFVPPTWLQRRVWEGGTAYEDPNGVAVVSIGLLVETDFNEEFAQKEEGAKYCSVRGIRGRCRTIDTQDVVAHSIGVLSGERGVFVECGGPTAPGLRELCKMIIGTLERPKYP